ncbi:PDGLE domain-containing protein [Microbacterium candidum]|uniref:PDGLE domain-containing protein n=1 Tax=Microbacterium candidum TaxID=3041922 RepID=A0ABT7MTE5_9MICO|nr:PDGLE domain-containing protein [Microbacterium sp. ASV49]MDL9977716.1 PDGLE domain-containing protein [Microbacterium sp. ASV49]
MSTTPRDDEKPRVSTRTFFIVGGIICLVLATVVSLWASPHPDGLMHVAKAIGILSTEKQSATAGSPLAGYGFAGIGHSDLAKALAGAVGCILTFAVAIGIGLLVRRSRRSGRSSDR